MTSTCSFSGGIGVRGLEDTASFFLDQFLPALRLACPDALQNFVLMGHSFGGMVISVILQENNALLTNMTHAVTVASPFYGYDGQIYRWFEGDDYLNFLGRRSGRDHCLLPRMLRIALS